jgi:hypothetical protein
MSRREELKSLFLVTVITCVPVVGTLWAVISTTQPALSDLSPVTRQSGKYALLDWPALRQESHAPNAELPIISGAAVQALGYMVEGEDKPAGPGTRVKEFVLLSEAGNIIHPAHRFGDEMIAVHLREGDEMLFSPRRLVWVWGTFRASLGDPAGPKPLYHLDQAQAQPADRTDIRRYFELKRQARR